MITIPKKAELLMNNESRDAIVAFAVFSLMPHNIKNIDRRSGSLIGMHDIMSQIEFGLIQVYCASDENNNLLGICYGKMRDNIFNCHLLFDRHVDTVKCCAMMIEKLKDETPECKSVRGDIPATNKRCLKLSKECGFKDCGASELFFVNDNGDKIECRKYIKDL